MKRILKNDEDIKAWIYEHDARIDAWWVEQRNLNTDITKELAAMGARLSTLERKVIFWSGGAAVVGSLIGAFLFK